MDNEALKTEIVREADALADLALQGKLSGVVIAWMTVEGRWAYTALGQIAPLTTVGMIEGVKAHLLGQCLPPDPVAPVR